MSGETLESSATSPIVDTLSARLRAFSRARTAHRGDLPRPFVTLSYAQSLDGSIAVRPDRPMSLSGPDSLQLTHELRSCHDGILVGIRTVLADDPRLTVRLVKGRDPQAIVVDSQLRLPADSNLLRCERKVWLATTDAASPDRQRAAEKQGARVLRLPQTSNGWVDLRALMATLSEAGIEHLLVEGGGRIITSFLSARLADYAVVTLSPQFVGGFSALSPHVLTTFPRLRSWQFEKFGEDLVVAGQLTWDDGRG